MVSRHSRYVTLGKLKEHSALKKMAYCSDLRPDGKDRIRYLLVSLEDCEPQRRKSHPGDLKCALLGFSLNVFMFHSSVDGRYVEL